MAAVRAIPNVLENYYDRVYARMREIEGGHDQHTMIA